MAAGEMVICAGGAAVTVAVDSGGNPVGAPHWCPDCVISLLAALPAGPGLAPPSPPAAARAAGPVAGWRAAAATPVPPARGPPAG
jgi:hypothetical protein